MSQCPRGIPRKHHVGSQKGCGNKFLDLKMYFETLEPKITQTDMFRGQQCTLLHN